MTGCENVYNDLWYLSQFVATTIVVGVAFLLLMKDDISRRRLFILYIAILSGWEMVVWFLEKAGLEMWKSLTITAVIVFTGAIILDSSKLLDAFIKFLSRCMRRVASFVFNDFRRATFIIALIIIPLVYLFLYGPTLNACPEVVQMVTII